MSFPISAALLDAIVLSVVAQEPEGTYGYKITQQVTHTLELSESTHHLSSHTHHLTSSVTTRTLTSFSLVSPH